MMIATATLSCFTMIATATRSVCSLSFWTWSSSHLRLFIYSFPVYGSYLLQYYGKGYLVVQPTLIRIIRCLLR